VRLRPPIGGHISIIPTASKDVCSILESKVQALVTILLSFDLVRLVRNAVFAAHSVPSSGLALVQPSQILSLQDEHHERESADRDEDLVAAVVIRYIVLAVKFCMPCQWSSMET
jgi:hypothetical protein